MISKFKKLRISDDLGRYLGLRSIKIIAICYVVILLIWVTLCDMQVVNYTKAVQCYNETVLWWLIGVIGIFCLFLFTIIRRHERLSVDHSVSKNEKLALMIQNSCHGRFTDIIYVLAFLLFLDWLPDSISSCVHGGSSGVSILIFLVGMVLLVYGKPTLYNQSESVAEDRKVLVSGFSTITPYNCEPFFEPFKEFRNIEKVVVLMTDNPVGNIQSDNQTSLTDIQERTAILQQEVDCIRKCSALQDNDLYRRAVDDAVIKYIKDCIKIQGYPEGKGVDVILSDPVDYNSFKKCNEESVKIINQVISEGDYEDKNLLVNITPGTAIVHSVMTLNSIKGDRLLVYVNQKTKKLITDDSPSVYLLQFDDIINERN